MCAGYVHVKPHDFSVSPSSQSADGRYIVFVANNLSQRTRSSIVNRGKADSSKAVHSGRCAAGHRRQSCERVAGVEHAHAAMAAGYDPKARAAGPVAATPAIAATAEDTSVCGAALVSSGRELKTSLA